MSTAGSSRELELVVAEDGSIPAEQIANLGVSPGAHLRVVVEPTGQVPGSIVGRLTNWPELRWEGFERASTLAKADLSASWGSWTSRVVRQELRAEVGQVCPEVRGAHDWWA